MRLAELCFTYRGHYALAASTDNPSPDVHRFWCVEPSDANLVPPEGVELLVRDFPRNRNLNGWDCVEGMTAVYAELFARGFETVIKRDSDTRVLRPQGMAVPPGRAMLGVSKPMLPSWQLFGACYAVSPMCLEPIAKAIAAKAYHDNRVPEDQFFSQTLRELSEKLPHARASFPRNEDRSLESDPLWINYGNRWENEAWYAARRPKSAPVVVSVVAPPSSLRAVATAVPTARANSTP